MILASAHDAWLGLPGKGADQLDVTGGVIGPRRIDLRCCGQPGEPLRYTRIPERAGEK